MTRPSKRKSDRIFRKNDRSKWYCRVKPLAGDTAVCSTGTHDPREAERIVAMLDTLREQRHFDLLAAAARKEITLASLYDAFVSDRLGSFRSSISDIDLSPWVEKWNDELTAGGEHKEKTVRLWYVRVRDLIQEDEPFPRSQLNEERVIEWVGSLAERGKAKTTRHHYGIAIRAFAGWATRRKALPFNPLAEWSPPSKGAARDTYWQWDACKRVLDAMPDGEPGSLVEKYKVAMMLMLSTGMELSACMAVRGKDVNRHLRTVWAHGRKTERQGAWRNRNCHVRKWAWSRIEKFAKTYLHNAELFEGVAEVTLRQHFYDAQAAVGLADKVWNESRRDYDYQNVHTIHDSRHTYCYLVCSGEDGDRVPKLPLHYCKRQLGHGSLKMVQEIYANFGLGDAPDADGAVETDDDATLEVETGT